MYIVCYINRFDFYLFAEEVKWLDRSLHRSISPSSVKLKSPEVHHVMQPVCGHMPQRKAEMKGKKEEVYEMM